MKRHIFIPEQGTRDLITFASLTSSQIQKLESILSDTQNFTPLDIYVAIMNELDVDDDTAASIYNIYNYVVQVVTEKQLAPGKIIDELVLVLKNTEHDGADEAVMQLETNRTAFEKLLSADSMEGLAAKKRSLESGFYGSVVDIRSVCDLRPVFNPERTEILDWLSTIYFEFSVIRGQGFPELVPISLDVRAFQQLREEVDRVERKLKIIEEEAEAWKA